MPILPPAVTGENFNTQKEGMTIFMALKKIYFTEYFCRAKVHKRAWPKYIYVQQKILVFKQQVPPATHPSAGYPS